MAVPSPWRTVYVPCDRSASPSLSPWVWRWTLVTSVTTTDTSTSDRAHTSALSRTAQSMASEAFSPTP